MMHDCLAHHLAPDGKHPRCFFNPRLVRLSRALCCYAVLVFGNLLTPTQADQNERGGGFVEITAQSRQSVERGLTYLAESQSEDGSFNAHRYGQHVGVTALACMAFMADGHLPGRGRYGDGVQRGLEFILNNAHETGLIAADTSHGPMYGHGFATLFLGEVYGMTGDRRVREALIKAVNLIVTTQNAEGGWRYHPARWMRTSR